MKYLTKALLVAVVAVGTFIPLSFSSNGFIGLSLAHAEIVTTVVNNIVAFIAIIPVLIGTFLLFISGLVLDITITETILKFASFANTDGLNNAWRTFRDLGNIFIVFVLLTISIATIIGSSGYGLKALLAKVIIVALLLNFSLFFTKFVIEITNRLAVEFYSKIVAPNSSSGISAAFMQTANLNSFWDFDKEKFQNLKTDEGTGRATIIVYGIFVGIFFSVTAAVFIFASFLLITRAVILSLLMILSPLAFVAYTLPATRKHASTWWDALSRNAVFAPIFLILMWATFQVADTLPTAEGSFSSVFLERNPDTLEIVFSFAIIIGLAVSSIIVAQKLSISGGAGALKGLKGLGRGAAGLTARGALSGTSLTGRTTLNYLATKFANSKVGQSLKETRPEDRSAVGRFFTTRALRGLDRIQTGSFDVRQTKIGQSALKGLGINAGKGAKGGVRGAAERAEKREVEDSKLYSASGDELDRAVDAELVARGRELQEKAEGIKQEEDRIETETGKSARSFERIVEDISDAERKKIETAIKDEGRREYAKTRSEAHARAIREDLRQDSQAKKDAALLNTLKKLEEKE